MGTLTLREFLRDYYAPLKGITDRTCELYELTIRPFSQFIGHDATLDDLDELAIARFLSHRLKTRAAATAAKDRAQLRAMWELAARKGFVKTWPMVKRIVVPERIPEAWLTDEMTRLFRAIESEKGWITGIKASLWWRAIVMLGYQTGERCGGLLALRWRDASEAGVVFRAEGRKGRRRDTYREIDRECYEALAAIRGDRGPNDTVFPWDKAYTYIWDKLGGILQRAGLPKDRRCKFHKIRRTTASYYEAAGGSAQQLLDHSSPKVTKAYLDPRIVKSLRACDAIPKVG
jgi:integrase